MYTEVVVKGNIYIVNNTLFLEINVVYFIADPSSITSLTLNSDSNSSVVTVDELTAVTLRCDVDSNPLSTINLLNNSLTLLQVTNSKQAEYTWNETGCQDTGIYTCEATNEVKSAVNQRVQLVVLCEIHTPLQKAQST